MVAAMEMAPSRAPPGLGSVAGSSVSPPGVGVGAERLMIPSRLALPLQATSAPQRTAAVRGRSNGRRERKRLRVYEASQAGAGAVDAWQRLLVSPVASIARQCPKSRGLAKFWAERGRHGSDGENSAEGLALGGHRR